jgi:hypothetical protein
MVLHDVTFNVTVMILNLNFFIFFKKFYKVHNVEVLNQHPRQQKEFLLTHNYKYGIEI